MKTLVVYDSKFGNTKLVAQAIGDALAGLASEVEVLHVDDVKAPGLAAYELLIAGAPTHGGRPSDPMKALLREIQPRSLAKVRVAGFDTRLTHKLARLLGFAAPKIARALEKKGGTPAGPPGDFYVTGGEGPLEAGELERAALWAKGLVGGP